ncbi:TIGR02466 family protein [Sphingomonas sp. MMS12-HWE2-04]|uniref:TIGR02466 family protein n=1 Tax=Sphingomonas sp. MMS12-HWE2-04 TaxID=3234199 RepID=UPI00384E6749
MTIRSLFATRFYEGALDDAALLEELEDACLALAQEDRAGRAWSKAHGYRGYTSYASLADLPQRDPRFGDLVRILNRHVARFAEACGFDLGGHKLKLDSLWVNVLKPGGTHSGHIHPHSVVSGTIYVTVPPGSGALKLEDPRLAMLMAAPTRLPEAAADLQPFVYAAPAEGSIFLWESWLRHEVTPNAAKSDRVSISFNYRA